MPALIAVPSRTRTGSVRYARARALGWIGPEAKEAVPALTASARGRGLRWFGWQADRAIQAIRGIAAIGLIRLFALVGPASRFAFL